MLLYIVQLYLAYLLTKSSIFTTVLLSRDINDGKSFNFILFILYYWESWKSQIGNRVTVNNNIDDHIR